MANVITRRTLVDSERNLVVNCQIDADATGAETVTLIDVSTYAGFLSGGYWDSVKVNKVEASLSGFSAVLAWNATTDVPFANLADGDTEFDWRPAGGMVNNKATGYNGDIDIEFAATIGDGDEGSVTLYMTKRKA